MNEKLKEIQTENIIVLIYYILLTIYLYANYIESNYIKYQNEIDKEKYRHLLYIVFGVTFILSLYFTINSVNDLKSSTNNQIYKLELLSTIANILVLLASAIILYIVYKDRNIDLEITP